MARDRRGIFITFEGPDGAGKTTQLRLLAQFIEQELQVPLVTTREPGGTPISDRIREILLNPQHKEMVSETEVLLYAASRAQHVNEKIVPALNRGDIILCDRFMDASIAYQGFGLGISVEKIIEINHFATGGVVPDRTYLLDLPEKVGKQRILKRNAGDDGADLDRIEQKELEYHKRVRFGFHQLAEMDRDRIVRVDANRPESEVHEEIRRDFLRFFQQNVGPVSSD
ncbi:MAG: dTMP kinase [Bacillaceae bacterium]|nr:dTMP kinase [Bacillaceae bacterium]